MGYFSRANYKEYNVTFPIEWAKRVLNYYDTNDSSVYIKDSDALLNIGNLNILYENGYAFENTES